MSVYEKNGKFYYKCQVFGIRKHGACRGCKDISHAIEYEAEIKNKISLIHRKKMDESEMITVEEMFNEFLAYSKINNKPSTYNDNEHRVEVLKNFFGCKTIIAEIKNAKIEELKTYITKDLKDSKSTFNRYFAVLKKAYNLIIINRKLNLLNPCSLVKPLKTDNAIMRYLTEEEEKKLMKELAPHLKPIVICALTTGLRLSNILNLKWESINFKVGFIEILKQENKGHKKIQIPLSKKLKKELKKIGVKKSGYVFINPDTNKPYTTIKTGFSKALDRAGIENFRFHDLRHTVGTRLVAKGVDLQTVKEIMAHSDIKTTQRYLHPVKENIKKAVDILDKF